MSPPNTVRTIALGFADGQERATWGLDAWIVTALADGADEELAAPSEADQLVSGATR